MTTELTGELIVPEIPRTGIITTGTLPIATTCTEFVTIGPRDGSWIWVPSNAGSLSVIQPIRSIAATTSEIIIPTNGTTSITYNTVSTDTRWFISGTGNWINVNNCQPSQEELDRRKRKYQRDRRSSVYKARSAIKKALKLVDNMGFGDEIRIFIGGDEIVIDNPNSIFKFVLKRGHQSIIERTISPGYSTPYSLELLTKDDVHVANLCVYLKDTPVLDQILAVALYIKTGDEEDVLDKANWFNKTNDDGVRRLVNEYNPKFGKKLGFKLPQQEPEGYFTVDNIHSNIIVGNHYVQQYT